ncbi:MAG: hypothetical protein V1760_03470, partial [Candidatus Peregrinibacteria bacterium]
MPSSPLEDLSARQFQQEVQGILKRFETGAMSRGEVHDLVRERLSVALDTIDGDKKAGGIGKNPD